MANLHPLHILRSPAPHPVLAIWTAVAPSRTQHLNSRFLRWGHSSCGLPLILIIAHFLLDRVGYLPK